MYEYYVVHVHRLIMNEILKMFMWKADVSSVYPFLYASFPKFLCEVSFSVVFWYVIHVKISLYILWKPAIKTIILIVIIIIIASIIIIIDIHLHIRVYIPNGSTWKKFNLATL